MKLNPKFGIDQLLFGMKAADVSAIYGQPDKEFEDEDQNTIQLYNAQQWRLTFYQDEDFRLGYIITSNPMVTLFDQKVIGSTPDEVKNELVNQKITSWEMEDFDLAENHFNEDHWLILQSEFNKITKVEIGAIINNNDDFDWKFGKK